MIKRLKRWYRNEPNSKLTTLCEQRCRICPSLRKGKNVHPYKLGNLHICDSCVFSNTIHGNRNLAELIKELEQIHEQTKQLN